MRFAHLSDLHIGKRVNGFSMIEDQKYILNQVVEIIKREEVEAVILAGDIYDKTIPSAEAVQILDDFLIQLSNLNLPIFVISGNHDSAERLSFGARVLRKSQIYISELYNGEITPITLEDEYGKIHVYLMPFLKPALVRQALGREEIVTYQDAVEMAIHQIPLKEEDRNILVAHQFVIGASKSDSEEVSVGGLDQISHTLFESFDYTALGHIHGPQHIGKETIRYCGTPLKYSFSEEAHTKSVTIIDLEQKGKTTIRMVPLIPMRDMRKIRGKYEEIINQALVDNRSLEDYIQITLTDEEDVLNGLENLRKIYPNIMRFEYDNKRTREQNELTNTVVIEQRSELELFEEFYFLQNNQEISKEQRELLQAIIEEEKDVEDY